MKFQRKRLLSDIYDLSRTRACNAGTNHFIKKYGWKKRSVERYFSELEKAGLITRVRMPNTRRVEMTQLGLHVLHSGQNVDLFVKNWRSIWRSKADKLAVQPPDFGGPIGTVLGISEEKEEKNKESKESTREKTIRTIPQVSIFASVDHSQASGSDIINFSTLSMAEIEKRELQAKLAYIRSQESRWRAEAS